MTALQILPQPDGDGFLVLVEKVAIGTLRKVEGGWRTDGMEGLFAQFKDAVIHVCNTAAQRHHQWALSIWSGLVKASLEGSLVEPKVTK